MLAVILFFFLFLDFRFYLLNKVFINKLVMKKTLKETITEFKRLTTEATSTSSSGAYEVPLGYNNQNTPQVSPCDTQPPLVGSEIMTDAPSIEVVDITTDTVGVEPEGWSEVPFDYDFSQGEEDSMVRYFDESDMDEEDDSIFTSLEMFTETTKGVGW